jgi:hypothetical protein
MTCISSRSILRREFMPKTSKGLIRGRPVQGGAKGPLTFVEHDTRIGTEISEKLCDDLATEHRAHKRRCDDQEPFGPTMSTGVREEVSKIGSGANQ